MAVEYVECGVYTVSNIFNLLLLVNISVKKNYEDQIRPHLLNLDTLMSFHRVSQGKK